MTEVEKLKGFILTTIEYVGISVSKEALQPILNSNSKSGLRMAAKDMAEFYEDLSSHKIAELDAILEGKSLPTISQMYKKNFREFLKIISKGVISNDDQFRLVNSVVSNIANDTVSAEDRRIADSIMGKYEASKKL